MSEPLLRRVNREQMMWRAVDVEQLIGEEHTARAIWELVGRLDLEGFYAGIECSEEEGGRPAYDPRLLISLWIYAYSRGIGSAREVARRCEWEPAFEWLTGCEVVNYHTLSSFRVEYRAELDELFTQVLALMSAEGLITLEQVVQDGTKIKAQAASDSFQGEAKIGEHLERARRRVREMGEPDAEQEPGRVEQAHHGTGGRRPGGCGGGEVERNRRRSSFLFVHLNDAIEKSPRFLIEIAKVHAHARVGRTGHAHHLALAPEQRQAVGQRQLEVDDVPTGRGLEHDRNMPERLMLTDWVS